jgi:NAD-dependent deacetylase
VITQNVDGLHQKTGVPEHQIIELHGNSTYASCLECAKRYELAEIRKIFEDGETLPVCDHCHGIVKTATISFGQPMPVSQMEAAESETMACDLFMAIGSSLVVYPAAGFPELAARNKARLIIINRDPTSLDELADLVLRSEIGLTLSEAVGLD